MYTGSRIDRYTLYTLHETFLRAKIIPNCICTLLLILFHFGFNIGQIYIGK